MKSLAAIRAMDQTPPEGLPGTPPLEDSEEPFKEVRKKSREYDKTVCEIDGQNVELFKYSNLEILKCRKVEHFLFSNTFSIFQDFNISRFQDFNPK